MCQYFGQNLYLFIYFIYLFIWSTPPSSQQKAIIKGGKKIGEEWERIEELNETFLQYYRKRGSASYIVREWLLWVVERERETPVTSSISRWNREWSCIWLPRQRVDPMHMHTRRRVLSLQLLSSARSAWQAKTTNSNSCDRAVAQVNKIQKHIPEQPGWMNSKYWGNIEKRNQINTKNYWK